MKVQNRQLKELFKTPQRKTYTMVGVTAVTVGLFVFLTIRPTFIKIADLNKEIQDKETFLSKIEKKLETLNYLISQKETSSTELEVFLKDFPEEEKGGFIVANLAQIAEQYDNILKSITFNDELDSDYEIGIEYEENIKIVQVDIVILGDLDDIEKFVEYIETFPRIFDIKSVRYSREDLNDYEDNIEDYKSIQCSMSLYTYYWTDGEE